MTLHTQYIIDVYEHEGEDSTATVSIVQDGVKSDIVYHLDYFRDIYKIGVDSITRMPTGSSKLKIRLGGTYPKRVHRIEV
jgi:hypothetical protein